MTASREAACDPDDVIELIVTPETWPQWQPEIVAIDAASRTASDRVVHGHAKLLGFGVQGRSTQMAVDDARFEEDVIVGVRMRVSYEIRPRDGKTVVTRRLVADLPWGPAGRVLSFFLRRRLSKMQQRVVDELARRAERAKSRRPSRPSSS